jgi:hypothetical protein
MLEVNIYDGKKIKFIMQNNVIRFNERAVWFFIMILIMTLIRSHSGEKAMAVTMIRTGFL